MDLRLDSHTHTLASGHAYNTIMEMARAASEKKLDLLGITEHAPMLKGSCTEIYFVNLKVVPRQMFGVELLLGAELNILDTEGKVDLPQHLIKKMDVVVASFHNGIYPSGTVQENTRAYLKIMENPYVNIIGHPDDGRFPVDMEALVLGAKEHHVLLELNNNSLNPACGRQNPFENDVQMLKYCMKYDVPIIMDSDAHWCDDICACDFSMPVIRAVDFPEELVINRDVAAYKTYVNKYKFS